MCNIAKSYYISFFHLSENGIYGTGDELCYLTYDIFTVEGIQRWQKTKMNNDHFKNVIILNIIPLKDVKEISEKK